MVNKKYTDDGIVFDIQYDGKAVVFPMDLNSMGIADHNSNSEWDTIQLLEQLWDEGMLSLSKDGYILKSEDIYEVDDSECKFLGIPSNELDISLKEQGMITMPSHRFKYNFLYRGNSQMGTKRFGNIVIKGKKEYLLNKAQWKLISAIDSFDDNGDKEYRARHFAYVKKLAKRADAIIEPKINQREFIFVEDVDLGIEKISDQELKPVVATDDVSTDLMDEVVENLNDVVTLTDNRVNYRVFLDENAREKSEKIKSLDNIKGADVPEFIENPYKFIPEEIEIDEMGFAERVKGLKIHKARAIPFVSMNDGEHSNGWFDIDMGINIESDGSDTDSDDWKIDNYEEFKSKVDQAIENDDSYVFINDQWIKVDKNISEFIDAHRESEQYLDDGHISRENARKILDIYDNLDCIEYDENTIEIRKDIRNPLRQYSVPEAFNGTLDVYQIEGYNFLRQQNVMNYGSLLADDMGLGKTVQVIALLSYLYEQDELKPLLLVIPTALFDNWINELKKFLPALDGIYIHRGVGRLKNCKEIERYNMTIVSYETLARDQVVFGRIKWSYVICDETQKIKNFNTLAANAVKGMNTSHRIAMTGTPIENNLSELWSIIDFIQPGLLGSHKKFVSTYERPLKRNPEDVELKDTLINTIKPVFIRRTKKGILSDILPEKKEETIRVPMGDEQKQLYMEIIDSVKSSEVTKMHHLSALNQLIELCSHPWILSESPQGSVRDMINQSPKLMKTLEIIESVKQKNEKVIIFTRYHKMQSILRKAVYDVFKIDARIINGKNSVNRAMEIEQFQTKPGFNVLILSPKSAGVGLNITAANHVIHYTREWNPAVENQATDRVYRRGQDRDVHVYYPVVCADEFITVEEKLDSLLSSKRELMEDIIIVNGLDVQNEMEDIFEQ